MSLIAHVLVADSQHRWTIQIPIKEGDIYKEIQEYVDRENDKRQENFMSWHKVEKLEK